MEDKPLTVYMVTALVLWALYLWRQGRLGRPALLPMPPAMRSPSGPPVLPPVPGTPGAPQGWQPGTPPVGGQ